MTDQRRPLIAVDESTLRIMATQVAETYNQALMKRAANLELKARGYVTDDPDAQAGYAAASAVDTDKLPTVDIGLEWIE